MPGAAGIDHVPLGLGRWIGRQSLPRRLPHPGGVGGPAGYGFVEVHVAVADLDVVAAGRVATHPGLVVNRRTLAAEIGQR